MTGGAAAFGLPPGLQDALLARRTLNEMLGTSWCSQSISTSLRRPSTRGLTVAVAIGTVGAVVYALSRDLFLANRRRPQLEFRFDATGKDQVVVGTVGNTDAAHVRLRLSNREGKDTAANVVVIVTEVHRLEESEGTDSRDDANRAAADLVGV